MANVRLLRQSVEDYQKKLKAGNENYEADFAAYQAQVEAHNAGVAAITAASANPLGSAYQLPSGKFGLLSSSGVKYEGNPYASLNAFADSKKDYGYVHKPNGTTTLYRRNSTGWGTTYTIVGDYPTLLQPPAVGAEPTQAEMPKDLNLTASNVKAVMNPGLNQAQAQLQAAKGIVAKSDLAGDQGEALKNSAFAKQDDPQGLKERGVLARVMGGQL